jgi:hypothetical protein
MEVSPARTVAATDAPFGPSGARYLRGNAIFSPVDCSISDSTLRDTASFEGDRATTRWLPAVGLVPIDAELRSEPVDVTPHLDVAALVRYSDDDEDLLGEPVHLRLEAVEQLGPAGEPDAGASALGPGQVGGDVGHKRKLAR